MRLAILLLLLFCCATALGQTNAPPPSDSKPKAQDGGVVILSDTQGVDFGPYLEEAIAEIKEHWYHRIRERDEKKKGKLAIEFALTKEGKLADMRLVASSGDATLDRPAWEAIKDCNPFKPLPDKFTGPYLALRLRFYYNPEKFN